MGLFKKKEERSMSYNALIESLSSNNIYISKNTVEKIPVVYESIKKIAGTIASLPIEYCHKQNNVNNFIDDDVRLFLLNVENNEYSTSYNLKYSIVEDLLLYGKSYCFIERKGTKIKGLHHINYETVTEKKIIDENGVIIDKEINYTLNSMVCNKNAYEILIIDSCNKGILNSNKILELMLQHDYMLENVIKNIAMPSGYLKSSGRLTQQTIDRMKDSWKKLYSGGKNAGKTIILEEGLEYKTFDIDLNKLQSLDNKKAFVEDIQRLFNLYNIKDDREYLKYVVTPLISCIENALNSQLLLTREKENNYKFIFDTEMIDRATEKTRMETIILGLNSGIYTINEARERLDMEPFILDSNDAFLSLSMGKIMLKQNGTVVMPNIGTKINMDGDNEITNISEGEEENGTVI